MSYADFQYVIKECKPAKISFLSGKDRWDYKEKLPKVPPDFYDTGLNSISYRLEHKIRSNKGVGSLANLSPRFQRMTLEEIPAPNKYNLMDKKLVKKAKYPFDVKLPRFCLKENKNISPGPGPGSYNTENCNIKRKLKVEHSFGGRTKIIDPIEIICMPITRDVCEICGIVCEGCYWHHNFINYLCKNCMKIEKYHHKKYKKEELKNFKRIRECSFMHEHEGTTAAVRLISKNEYIIKKRLENYLDLYLKSN